MGIPQGKDSLRKEYYAMSKIEEGPEANRELCFSDIARERAGALPRS
jgi:hypothetical protein